MIFLTVQVFIDALDGFNGAETENWHNVQIIDLVHEAMH